MVAGGDDLHHSRCVHSGEEEGRRAPHRHHHFTLHHSHSAAGPCVSYGPHHFG